MALLQQPQPKARPLQLAHDVDKRACVRHAVGRRGQLGQLRVEPTTITHRVAAEVCA